MGWAALTQTDFPIVKTYLQYQSQIALTIWTYSSMLICWRRSFSRSEINGLNEHYCYCNQLSFILFWRRIRKWATSGRIHISCWEDVVISHLCFDWNYLKLSSLPLDIKEMIAFYSSERFTNLLCRMQLVFLYCAIFFLRVRSKIGNATKYWVEWSTNIAFVTIWKLFFPNCL